MKHEIWNIKNEIWNMKHETNLLSVSDKSSYKLHFSNNKDTSSCAAEFAWKHYWHKWNICYVCIQATNNPLSCAAECVYVKSYTGDISNTMKIKHETWNIKHEIWNMKHETWNMKNKP